MAWTGSLLLFLALATITCENGATVVVDAFAATKISGTRGPSISSVSGRSIILRSSSLVEEEVSSASKEKETETPSSLESSSIVDTNDDPDIASMMNKGGKADGEEEESEEENLMQQVKDAGLAGVISYAAWEFAFWTVSVPVCVLGYREVTGHWPDLNDKDDLSKLGAEAFAFVNFARFAVPLRIGLALGTTPWIQENIVDKYLADKEASDDDDSNKDNDDNKAVVVEGEGGQKTDVVAAVVEADEGTIEKVGRFRIRSRVGNLVNRVFKRSN